MTGAAAMRERVAVEQLIPRTDRNVARGPAWLETIRGTAARPEAARAHLRGSAMLDMPSYDAEGAIPHA